MPQVMNGMRPHLKDGIIHMRSMMLLQGLYYFSSGLWPILDIVSFQQITGPKTDLWLVKTVGLLTTAIGVVLVAAAFRRTIVREAAKLSFLSALAFWIVDWFYFLTGVLKQVYFIDGCAQGILVFIWIVFYLRRQSLA